MTSVSIAEPASRPAWGFLTSHALALLELSRTPDETVAEIARRIGLTERQTHRVLDDLVRDGYVERTRVGRRNRYTLDESRSLRHPAVRHHRVGRLLGALTS